MTVKEAKQIIKQHGDREIMPGTKEMTAMLLLATMCARNKS